jgi:hypothetical protein
VGREYAGVSLHQKWPSEPLQRLHPMIVNASTGEHETWMTAERAAPDRLLYAASHSVYRASNGLLDKRVTGPPESGLRATRELKTKQTRRLSLEFT